MVKKGIDIKELEMPKELYLEKYDLHIIFNLKKLLVLGLLFKQKIQLSKK